MCGALGTEVRGLDLSESIPARDLDRIHRAWIDTTLVLFRSQKLTASQQLEFSRQFGEVTGYGKQENVLLDHPDVLVLSNVVVDGRRIGAAVSGRYWHTDGHYMERPPSASLLYAVEVPPVGGDTWFANMHAAYDALPDAMKARIEGLRVIISRVQSRPYNYPDRPAVTDAERAAWPDVAHPLVRTHPISGRKALYVGGNVPWRIVNMEEHISAPLITELQRFAVEARFTYAHRWQAGDLILWDNRSAMHKATPYDDVDHRRIMHRVTLGGDAPF